ncbi:MAG: hypothetical protein HY001_00860 [Candidatus Portnoybacteria bacterium]|nr:hypothetical protein [Candidatus Portnoybacteria bacterium]
MEEKTQHGLQAAVEGFAHEHIAAGILMKKYQNVSLVDLPLSPYDLVIVLKEKGKENIIRAQVKTARKSVSFIGGTRGGVDRTYKSDVKRYVQSPLTSDVVIGLCPKNGEKNAFDLYFVPTILIVQLKQGSISLKKVEKLKNNYEILDRCKDKQFVIEKAKEYGII